MSVEQGGQGADTRGFGSRWMRAPGVVGLVVFVLAALVSGARLQGYSHREHPLALLGGSGVPGAMAFNLAAFVLPGLIAAWSMWRLRSGLQPTAAWRDRIATQLLLLSSLAFAAQGVFPLDPDDPGAQANDQHAIAWTIWWLGFGAAGAMTFTRDRLRGAGGILVSVASMVLLLVLVRWPGVMAALAPRLAIVVWLCWMAWSQWHRRPPG